MSARMARFLGTPVRLEQSAGAVVFRRTSEGGPQILLIRDRYGNWGLPKGHIEEGESAEEAALRECGEETGLERTRTIARLSTIDWYFRFGDTSVHKYCDYFLVEADDGEEVVARREQGVDRVRWAASAEALGHLTYENARRVVREALDRLEAAGGAETGRSAVVAEHRAPEEREVRHVFLTGGTGFVGGHLALELAERGHRLRALVRHPRSAAHLRELGADLVVGDVTRAETLTGAMDGCDVVVHIVGIIREQQPHATFSAVHVEGTRHMVEEASRAGVERFVHMSALDAAPEGTPYHRTKYEAEGIVRAGDPTHVIFRPAIIVGEGSEFLSMITRMVRFLPVVPVIGGGQYRLQPVAIEDVTAAFAQAAERDDLRDRTFEIGGPHRLTYNRVIEIVAEELGRRRRKLHLPLGLVRPLVETVTRLRVPTPIDAHELAMLLQESVVHEDRVLRDVFGIDPTPLRTVLQRIRAARRP